ncbi:MAG TPA: energy-coupling factor transporter transmembrane component T [Chloroflexia bacterium]|nr:energy-coupling factor transporter transmembrane component T [Chloroflexia bacterium]
MWGSAAYVFHVGAWGGWLAGAMLFALSTRNPFYLGLVMAAALLVNRTLTRYAERRDTGQAGDVGDGRQRSGGVLLRAVVLISLVVALFKGMSLHLGATVLFTLPEWIPILGGPVTLEALVSAGLDALTILTVLAVFVAFSAGADYYALLRSVPPFMHQAALVTSIGITFVPQTVTRFREIREAQALRGHRVRRIGDLVPLLVPLLAGGMERSMDLAEAMEARGFSRTPGAGRSLSPVVVQLGIAFGLGFVLVGGALFAFAPALPWLAWLVIGAGVALIAVTLRSIGAGVRRSRYRKTVWRDTDTVLTLASLGVLAALIAFRSLAPSLLAYTPFLRIAMPPFDLSITATIAGLLAPAAIVLIIGTSEQPPAQQSRENDA